MCLIQTVRTAILFFLVLFLFSNAATCAQQADELFEDVEPGVRLLGRPEASAVLGHVLKFKSIPETDRFVVVCENGIKLWDAKQQEIIKTLEFDGRISSCNPIEISHDQQLIAVSGWNDGNRDPAQTGIVRVVDQELNKQVEFVVDSGDGRLNFVSAMAFSKDDSSIALATQEQVFWCDLKSGEFAETFELGKLRPCSILIVERDRILGIGYEPYQIDRQDGKVSSLPKSLDSLNRLTGRTIFDETGNQIFATKNDTVSTIDLEKGTSESLDLESAELRLLDIYLSPDRSLLATVGLQNNEGYLQVSVFDIKTETLKYCFSDLRMRPSQIEFSDDNSAMHIAFSYDAGLSRLEFDPDQKIQTTDIKPNQPVRRVLLSDDGSKLAGSLLNSRGVEWDLETGKQEEREPVNHFFASSLSNGFFSMKQHRMEFMIMKSNWRNSKSNKIRSYSIRKPLVLPVLGYLSGVNDTAQSKFYMVLPSSLSLNESKTELHCVVNDMKDGVRIQTMELASKKRTRNVLFKRPKSADTNVFPITSITSDGERFAVVDAGKLKLINVESKETVFEQPCKDVIAMQFSPKGDWLAVHTKQGVEILNPESGEEIKTIKQSNALFAYAFGADRVLLASRKKGGPVRVFDAKTWEVELEHKTETSGRVSASISSDGRRVAFALDNCRLELWELNELGK